MPKKKKSSKKLLWAVIGVVLVLALLLGGLRGITQEDDTFEDSTKPPENSYVLESGEYTFEIDDRPYLIYVPKSYDKTPMPLVINLHGGGGDISAARKQTQMESNAEKNDYLVVFPQGSGRTLGQKTLGTWNAGECCGTAEKKNIDDVAWISAMLDDLEKKFNIDTKKVYATGHSNGAMMAYRLGCDLSERITAVAANAGYDAYNDCNPSRKVPLLQIQGTADESAIYDAGVEGQCGGRLGDDGWSCRSVPVFMDEVAERNGCSSETTSVYDKGDALCVSYSSCDSETILCTIDGGGHTWAGGEYAVDLPQWKENVGHLSSDLDATEYMWKFFNRQSL